MLGNSNVLPFYTVMDMMKLLIQKIQDNYYYRCELDRLHYEHEKYL